MGLVEDVKSYLKLSFKHELKQALADAKDEEDKIKIRLKHETKLEETINNHKGSLTILRKIVEYTGINDLVKAVASLELRNVSPYGEKFVDSKAGGKITKGEVFNFVYKNKEQVFPLGIDASINLMQSFGTEKQKESVDKEHKKIIEKKNKDYTQISIDEKISEVMDNEKITKVKYITKKDKKAVKKLLKANIELEKYKDIIRILLDSNDAYNRIDQSNLISSNEFSGQLFGWYKHKLKDEVEPLPDSIENIFNLLNNKKTYIPADERKHLISILTTYEALNRKADAEAVIGSFIDDIEFLRTEDTLSLEQKLALGSGVPDRKDRITLLDAAKILSRKNIIDYREKYNKEHLDYNKNELNETIDRLSKYFMKNGQWIGKAYKNVPNKVKKTIYFSTLTLKDFRKIKNMLVLQTLTHNEQGLSRALDIKRFRKTIEDIVTIGRKIDYMDNYIKENNIEIDNEDNAKETAKKIKENMTRGDAYINTDEFKRKYGISTIEFCARITKSSYANAWKQYYFDMSRLLRLGLFKVEDNTKIKTDMIKELIDTKKKKTELKKANTLFDDNLINKYSKPKFLENNHEFITTSENYDLEGFVEGYDKALENTDEKEAKKIIEKANKIEKKAFYTSRAYENSSCDKFSISQYLFKKPYKKAGFNEVIDIKALENVIKTHKNRYICAKYLVKDDWLIKTELLFMYENRKQLSSHLDINDHLSKTYIENIRENKSKSYIDKEIISQVDYYFSAIENNLKIEKSVISNPNKKKLRQNEYLINIKGTTWERDGNKDHKFKKAFGEYLDWDTYKQKWHQTMPITKLRMIFLTKRLMQYNKDNNADISITIL